MEVVGKIYAISATQQVSATFSKREFIVETDEQFKQHILLQVVKDKCSILDQYKIGDSVTVSLNLKGRLWTNPQNEEKCFNTLECWKISKITDAPDQSAVNNYQMPKMPPASSFEPVNDFKEEDHPDLPF